MESICHMHYILNTTKIIKDSGGRRQFEQGERMSIYHPSLNMTDFSTQYDVKGEYSWTNGYAPASKARCLYTR